MRYIDKTKSREPGSLIEYRKWADPTSKDIFDDYTDKKVLRQLLLEEQGFICCYCMQRIKGEYDSETGIPDTRIEHWAPQTEFNGTKPGKPDLRLNYKNLMAACRGNEGAPEELEHCDKSKGEEIISINPTDPLCESKLYYGAGGELLAYDSTIQDEIGIDDEKRGILNLNNQTLKENRFDAFNAILDLMKDKKPEIEWRKQFIQTNIERVNRKNQKGYYPEYVGYILYFLRKRLDRAKP
jgi:uncharacterized protein (TIGR02646 family)